MQPRASRSEQKQSLRCGPNIMRQKRTSTKILCFLPSALTPALESCSRRPAEHIAATQSVYGFRCGLSRLPNPKSSLASRKTQHFNFSVKKHNKTKKGQQPDTVRGKADPSFEGAGRGNQQTTSWRAEIRATYLPGDSGGRVRRDL